MLRLAALLSIAAAAGGGGSCPDQVVESVSAELVQHNVQSCGGTFGFKQFGVTIQQTPGVCPLMIVATPPYSTTKSQPGSGTLTRPGRTVQGKIFTFECHSYWVFGIIPIVSSQACLQVSSQPFGAFTHYEQFPCADL